MSIVYALRWAGRKINTTERLISCYAHLKKNWKKVLPFALTDKKRKAAPLMNDKNEWPPERKASVIFPIPSMSNVALLKVVRRVIAGVAEAVAHKALAGVRVAAKGASRSTVSDMEGKYSALNSLVKLQKITAVQVSANSKKSNKVITITGIKKKLKSPVIKEEGYSYATAPFKPNRTFVACVG